MGSVGTAFTHLSFGPDGAAGTLQGKGMVKGLVTDTDIVIPYRSQVHQLPRHALEHRDKRHSGWTDGTRPSVMVAGQSRAVLVSSGRL